MAGGEGQVGGVVDSDGFLEGSVLVARHPVHDPASLQVFQAVCHPALKVGADQCSADALTGQLTAPLPLLCQSYLGQHAGLLLFSTRGPCSPAQALSGGDYDGDTFWVCAQPEVVQHVHKTASMTTSNLTQVGHRSPRVDLHRMGLTRASRSGIRVNRRGRSQCGCPYRSDPAHRLPP